MNLINLSEIQFSYSNSSRPVVQIPSLKIGKAERVFVYGPSGSGKTTLLEILAGVLTPQRGTVEILGSNISKLSASERDHFRAAHMGYIFQSFNLIPYLNVEDNIQLPLYLSPQKKSRSQDSRLEILGLCQDLGILDLLERRVTELSLGQQQRVAVARALIGQPEIILADEPTSSLDYNHRQKFISTLFEVCKKSQATVVFVSHDRSLEDLFDRTLDFSILNQAHSMGIKG